MKDVLTIGLPTLMVLVGILLNRNDANRLDGRMSALDARLSAIESSLRGEIASVRTQFHSDFMMLLSADREQDKRITRLEEKL